MASTGGWLGAHLRWVMRQVNTTSVGQCNSLGKKVLKQAYSPVFMRKKSFEKVLENRPSSACRSLQQAMPWSAPAGLLWGVRGGLPLCTSEEPCKAV